MPRKAAQNIIVVGPHTWGKGSTVRQALGRALDNYPSYLGGHMSYVAYQCPGDAWVDEMGGLRWTRNKDEMGGPVELRRVSYIGGWKVVTIDGKTSRQRVKD